MMLEAAFIIYTTVNLDSYKSETIKDINTVLKACLPEIWATTLNCFHTSFLKNNKIRTDDCFLELVCHLYETMSGNYVRNYMQKKCTKL